MIAIEELNKKMIKQKQTENCVSKKEIEILALLPFSAEPFLIEFGNFLIIFISEMHCICMQGG